MYNVTAGGEPLSWAAIAAEVFAPTGHDRSRVTPMPTADYFATQGKAEGDGTIATRPRNSVLELSKIEATGFAVRDQREVRREYLGG